MEGLSERKVTVELWDRAGIKTSFKISHSQLLPTIDVNYSGIDGTQTVVLTLADWDLTTIDPGSIQVLFSEDRSSYSSANNILKSLLACVKQKINPLR